MDIFCLIKNSNHEPDARLPFESLHNTLTVDVWPLSVAMYDPFCKFQVMIVMSLEPLAKYKPPENDANA